MTQQEINRELQRLRRENKILRELIKNTATEKQYQAYLKGLKKTPTKRLTYEEKFSRESKKLRIKTKLIKLMREYNKVVQASKSKVKFPKITIKSLQKQGFKPTAKNLKQLESQLEDTIRKEEDNTIYPPEFLESMYEGIVFNMFKVEMSADLIRIAAAIRDGASFGIAVRKGTYNKEIFKILELLYDAVANGEEETTRNLLVELLTIIDSVARG